MMTAVDSNVILDVLAPPSEFSAASAQALRRAYFRGGLCIAMVVAAEIAPHLATQEALQQSLDDFGTELVAEDLRVAWLAGRSWQAYRARGGRRTRPMADFIVAAHSLLNADALLTRDRGFYRTHSSDLVVVDPREATQDPSSPG